ncbi:zona pellucida sperm-binding protein 3d.2 [Anguilla anguilla]|uniref:zona pellucida sperm-binding protein 3d.2 n=1 Tax=Anguilla anguilla TaxID=7936 RepID=UPI0015B27B40|nr:zona pellucida sperm-binding protein 3d.2 [Anguilla anguilla]
MFQHSIAPLVNKELMKPTRATGHEPMPENLKKVLLPDAPRRPTRPSRRRKDVVASCTFNKMRVRVRRKCLGSRALSSELSLGTCSVSNQTDNFFFFCYNVSQCGSNTTMINNRVVYSNTLHFTPEAPKSLIRTAVPFSLPIFCHYNRFHYSYKIGYLPEIKTHQFFKSMQPSSDFTLSACNARWERLPAARGYVIGSPMYFEARSPPVSRDQRLFVSFCYATPSRELAGALRFAVIENSGCMSHNNGAGSRSRFVRHKRDVLRFEVEAFVFEGVADERLYMHCEMFVANHFATEIAKSCTYNSTTGRWEELYGDTQVCTCCNSTCISSASAAELPATKKIVTSGSWVLEPDSGAVLGEATVEWDKPPRPETKSVTEALAIVTEPEIRRWTEPETTIETDPEIMRWTEPETTIETDSEIMRWPEPETTIETDSEIMRWPEPETTIETDSEIMRWPEPETTIETDSEILRWTEPETTMVTEPEIRRLTEPKATMVTETEIRRLTEPKATMVTEPEIRRWTQPKATMVTEPVTPPEVKRWPDKVPKGKPVKGSAVKEAEKGSVPRLSFKEVFGIP